ncbi:hypothetical protein N8539_02720 [Akkermansiaceae bacterium]|nr:hypothetical protein [bacterium]MDA7538036.1 hypothetical protein [Akkermansiaceae bacterium]MDA7630040.1 hypothetical protein [Akkermansiaceae bacterium]MDB4271922.1 hypothetical protein [Akkermansiaceae bacterium]MDB4615191.1 hypothetical protein [Akkermansiaceae bacterium]
MHHPSIYTIAPKSSLQAHLALKLLLLQKEYLNEIPRAQFLLGWAAIAYIAPNLRPEEAHLQDGGWPDSWKFIAKEAFVRAKAGEISQEELFPYIFPVKKQPSRSLAA